MNIFKLKLSYFAWHYGNAFKDIWRIYTNTLWFLLNFFSVSVLLKTLFSPWKRLSASTGSGNNTKFDNLIIGTIMRFIGFFVRLATIFTGLIIFSAFAILGIAFYAVWIFVPIIGIGSLFWGIISLTI